MEHIMSTAVITGKHVAAFRHPATGEAIYLLFERTYDTKDGPKEASWCCSAIGTYAQVLKRVFLCAASCEAQSLVTRGGPTKPEAYIGSWRRWFNKPAQMHDVGISLKLGGDAMFDSIPDSQVDTALATLARIGRTDLIDGLKGGPVEVSLHRDVDVIIGLYGVETRLPAWKVIEPNRGLGRPDASLAPQLARKAIPEPSVDAYAIDEQRVIVSLCGGLFRHSDSRCSAVKRYIGDIAYLLELQCSGIAARLIPKFRAACEAAPLLPDSTPISVRPRESEDSYYVENAGKLAVRLGLSASVDAAPESYTTTVGAVRAKNEAYLLCTLEDEQVDWLVAAPPPATPPAGVEAGAERQHALF